MDLDRNLVASFLSALDRDQVVLHPTDSIPGLTFKPYSKMAKELLCRFKGRAQQKPCIALVESRQKAISLWRPLPGNWQIALDYIWPAPLTIVWQADPKSCDSRLISPDGTLALRFPRLEGQDLWLFDVIAKIPYPLPTTSVNRQGMLPRTTWDEASREIESESGFYIPQRPLCCDSPKKAGQRASTIIGITGATEYRVFREGAVSRDELNSGLMKAGVLS